MAYEKIFTPPYANGWEDIPSHNTPVTAGIMDDYDAVIENIENFLDGSETVSPITKTVAMTQDVGMDQDGKLYTEPSSVGDYIWVELLDVTDDPSTQTDATHTLSDSIENYITIAVSAYCDINGSIYSGVQSIPTDLISIDTSLHNVPLDGSRVSTVKFPTTTSITRTGQTGNTYIYKVYGFKKAIPNP